MEELAEWVGGDDERFALAWAVMQNGSPRASECAAWLIDKCLVRWPDLLVPYQGTALDMLRLSYHQAVHRCLTKSLTSITIDDSLQMPMFDYCLEQIGDRQAPIATRCHAIYLAWSIAQPFRHLHDELAATIECHIEAGSPGFRSRGRKVLERIRREAAL